jgi:hypothetical protein
MGLLAQLKFLWDPGGTVASLVERWDPGERETEIECRASLQQFLRSALPHVRIAERTSGSVHGDLVVGHRVVVLIHRSLEDSSDYYHLVGRLAEYHDRHGALLMVVKGRVDEELRSGLQRYVESAEGPLATDFRVIQK